MTGRDMACSHKENGASTDIVVDVENLSFSYSGGREILRDVEMRLTRGSRCLLVGANGTGKSTLLRILAGKHLVRAKVVSLGKNAFMETPEGLRYLGTEWVNNPIVRTDMSVTKLIRSCGGEAHRERVEELMRILDIDDKWRMHQVSDGQRRRVQMLLGLLEPFDLLLMDEVTTDLDAIVRRDLLGYLMNETRKGATIVYATHIFDGLGGWPTHICHLSHGSVRTLLPLEGLREELEEQRKERDDRDNSALLLLVEGWLRSDKQQLLDQGEGMVKDRIEQRNEDRANGDRWYNYWNRF